MSRSEQYHLPLPNDDEHDLALPLPAELAEAWYDRPLACAAWSTNRGTIFMLKAPAPHLLRVAGPVPIGVRHELYAHAQAPVLRTCIRLHDRPNTPLTFEVFTDIANDRQRKAFAALGQQDDLAFLLYDEQHQHRLTKRVENWTAGDIVRLVGQAEQVRAAIPVDRYDFAVAQVAVLRHIRQERPPAHGR